ncbi:MAG: hypothetical protein IIU93_00765, partial [Alistipes sp.]|nr:hypothetical protein [Alistipes sp.]
MKKAFIYLMALVTFAACDNTETPNEPQPTPPTPTENIIQIVVDESRLTAYQVIYSIYPEDKDTYFYCDVMSKARFESADINEI